MFEWTERGVRLDGKEVPMAKMEKKLLCCFLSHPNTVLSRERLLREVWGYEIAGDTRTTDTHVKNLRAHLNRLGANLSIVTVRGVGYRLECGSCCRCA